MHRILTILTLGIIAIAPPGCSDDSASSSNKGEVVVYLPVRNPSNC